MIGGTNAENWTLTYDEDNRTTSIIWITNGVAHTIQNRYDALGRRISKTVDGMTTGYVLNLSGGMERILCDLDAGGNVTAWYVHGPDLGYRVDATNGLTCYHADAMANILALTDGNTNLVAQYAYTPYGRVLGSTDLQPLAFSPQPFRFVGSQGVMEEFPGLYFMRARYYSADAGVFLSTDPVKHIGPGWKPVAYAYACANPVRFSDPKGETGDPLTRWAVSAVSEVLDEGLSDLLVQLATDFGVSQETAQTSDALVHGVKDLKDLAKHASDLYRKTETPGDFLVDELGEYSGKAIFGLSKFLTTSVGNAGAAIGDRFHNALFGQSQPSMVLSSSTAGTTPMAVLKAPQAAPTTLDLPAAQISSPTQSTSTRAPAVGASGGGGSLIGPAVTSFSVASALNSVQSVVPKTGGVTTPMISGGGGDGNNAFSQVVNSVSKAASNAANSITQTVKNVVANVGQAITSAVNSIGNFFSGLFGGRRGP